MFGVKNKQRWVRVYLKVLKKIVWESRKKEDREKQTSFVIVDAQSVKNIDTAEEKGYDGGKKVSGIKDI